MNTLDNRAASAVRTDPVQWCFLLLLCSAYLQGGIEKAFDLQAAVAEMRHFGLEPALPLALLTIAGEIGASLMILSGRWRWAGALYLAAFTLGASLVANRFWELSGLTRTQVEHAFFEHLGLAGALMMVAWFDLRHTAQKAKQLHPKAPQNPL